ncbi:uncharacterized protein V3H82_000749 [Fundulus diaphanus]
MPMDEKTAQFFHHFEPLYRVIDDMPRPPASLLNLTEGELVYTLSVQSMSVCSHGMLVFILDLNSANCGHGTGGANCSISIIIAQWLLAPFPFQAPGFKALGSGFPGLCSAAACDGVTLISDLESEIFCDSVDSVEQLSNVKGAYLEGRLEGRRVGVGQGGEGAEDGKCQGPPRRGRDSGQEGSYHSWRERGILQRSLRNVAPGGGGGGLGRGGGDRSEGTAERMHETYLQQQIILALQRLREDMRSVVDRLEVVERLATTHGSGWRPCLHCAAASQQASSFLSQCSNTRCTLILDHKIYF